MLVIVSGSRFISKQFAFPSRLLLRFVAAEGIALAHLVSSAETGGLREQSAILELASQHSPHPHGRLGSGVVRATLEAAQQHMNGQKALLAASVSST